MCLIGFLTCVLTAYLAENYLKVAKLIAKEIACKADEVGKNAVRRILWSTLKFALPNVNQKVKG